MARGGKGKPASKSALQIQEDEEAKRKSETPLFSLEGLVVHKKKILALFVGFIVISAILLALVASISAPSNVTLTIPTTFAQAKSGELANFTLTVKNTAAFASYAYEVHALSLPAGWAASRGEDAFALNAGDTREVRLSLRTGPDAPPNHDYPVTIKVLVKSGDLSRTLSSTSSSVTVRILSTAVSLALESRVTTGAFGAGRSVADFTYSGCGPAAFPLLIEAPSDANITSVGFTVNFNASDPNATGFLLSDVGADGSVEHNATLTPVGVRVTLGAPGFSNFTKANLPSPPTLTVPISLNACANATSWNITLTDPIVNYQHPTPAGQAVDADASNPVGPTASAHFLVRVENGEARNLTVILGMRDQPKDWTFSPALATTPIPVPAQGSNTVDFSLNIAKSAPAGLLFLNLTACLQANANDCAEAPATVSMPPVRYFTVKSYVEPASLKVMYQGRALDILLLAQNAGNQPTAFTIDMPPQPGLTVSFRDASGNLTTATEVPLALNETRPLVMHVAADPSVLPSIYTLVPTFRNITLNQTPLQADLRYQVHVQEPPVPTRPAVVGSRLTVDFVGITAGGLLFDTDIFSVLPLVDQKLRPVHPKYVRPAASGIAPYEFTIKPLNEYNGTEHKGFEPYIVGAFEQETIVFWLTPAETNLPPTAFLKEETLIFEVKVTTAAPP